MYVCAFMCVRKSLQDQGWNAVHARLGLGKSLHPPRRQARHPPVFELVLSASRGKRKGGSRYAGLVPTVAFEADATLPRKLMSPGWIARVPWGVASSTLSPSTVVEFESLARKLDSVLLFEAQREKKHLDSCLHDLGVLDGAAAEEIRTFVHDLQRPLEDAGFRLASKRDLAISSALQASSQRVLRSEVVVDENRLIDLISAPGAAGACSSRVLIFWKGAGVEETGGGLFFEKLDYLQGEVLSAIFIFWQGLARGAWGSVLDGRSMLADALGTMTDEVKDSLALLFENASAPPLKSIGIASLEESNRRLGSSKPTGNRGISATGNRGISASGRRVWSDRVPRSATRGRARSARIGSIDVVTPGEVLRQSNTRAKVLRRTGNRHANMLLNRALARWGLVSSRRHDLSDFRPGGTWPPLSGRSALVQTAAMVDIFAHTHAHTHTHTHKTHTHTRTHTHTHTHTKHTHKTHTHTHTHSLSRTHTHTLSHTEHRVQHGYARCASQYD